MTIVFFLFYFSAVECFAQPETKNPFLLQISYTDKDSLFIPQGLKLQSAFTNVSALREYVNKLPALLVSKGYPVASVDSSYTTGFTTFLFLYLGKKYNLIKLKTGNIERKALSESGYIEKNILNKPINLIQLQQLQNRLLSYYERSGYPFASVYLDSIQIEDNNILAVLKAERSVLYHVDSIRVFGKANINKKFLQRYLGIPNGSVYNKDKLSDVDKRIIELPYLTQVQPSDVTMLGSGSVLNLYLQPKRSSQVNFLIGFLPSGDKTGKLQLTGDVNLDLKSLLGSGESILIKYQQLQQKSPRLNLGFSQPYILNSPFGIDFLFDLFKKDSSFLQINAQVGASYAISAIQSGKLFVQFQNSSLLSGGIDTNIVKQEKRLPVNIDVNSVNVGLQYDYLNTNYRYNPRTGYEISVTTSIGIKNVKPNNQITELKDPAFNFESLYDSVKAKSYQLRLKFSGAHYFPVGKLSTIKTSLTSGIFLSPGIFRNELFQLGGYKLLRGFNEESIYASRFAVVTAEYRALVSLNSYFFFFVDGGMVKNEYQAVNLNNIFIGSGLGLLYETKVGLLNISFAVGKRDDVTFNLRESAKLHFGYINYF
ncbi:MAG: BamA/TamA family outer membrane protein [Ferruginibacter sp.]